MATPPSAPPVPATIDQVSCCLLMPVTPPHTHMNGHLRPDTESTPSPKRRNAELLQADLLCDPRPLVDVTQPGVTLRYLLELLDLGLVADSWTIHTRGPSRLVDNVMRLRGRMHVRCFAPANRVRTAPRPSAFGTTRLAASRDAMRHLRGTSCPGQRLALTRKPTCVRIPTALSRTPKAC